MNPLSPAEAKELIRLCETGRLYEVEAWLSAGKSLIVPKEVRKAPLSVAMATGFHIVGGHRRPRDRDLHGDQTGIVALDLAPIRPRL